MTKEIEANKIAWGLLSKEHYETFKKRLEAKESLLSRVVEEELGDISGKSIIHLLCNTGADSISLARRGADVRGVDFVPENIFYAKQMARELGVKNIDFIESYIGDLKSHDKKYDMVFATEGVLNWLPELDEWAETVKYLLKEKGFLYLLDLHPFTLIFDGKKLNNNELDIYFPYFCRDPERFETIGGYASEKKKRENYEWMHTIGDIINSLAKAGLTIEFFNEYDRSFYNFGGEMEKDSDGFFHNPFFDTKLPFMFSLKARLN